MPRYKLSNIPTATLQAELGKRLKKLDALLKFRDNVDRQIAELEALAGQFTQAIPAAPKAKVARKKGRKAFRQTADEFVLGLLKGKTLTSSDLVAAWKKAGRGGTVGNALTKLAKAGKVKRAKLKEGKGSQYSLA